MFDFLMISTGMCTATQITINVCTHSVMTAIKHKNSVFIEIQARSVYLFEIIKYSSDKSLENFQLT